MLPRTGPLSGMRILDLSALAPGPFATMLMGDLGADIVTVERPEVGTHETDFHTLPQNIRRRTRAAGEHPLYRSRRSIVVDLKRPEGLEIVRALAARADVLIEGFRPDTCERLGIGYAELRSVNPALIYCSITGYGQDGSLRRKVGHDITYLAESGLLSATTRPGQRPGIPLNIGADFAAGGLVAAVGILAALYARQQTGVGTHIDVSMYEGLLALQQVARAYFTVDGDDPSWGGGFLSGGIPFYDCYMTADKRWLAVGALEQRFFDNLCDAIERPDAKELYSSPDRWGELRATFSKEFAGRSLEEWMSILSVRDTATAPVRSMTEAFSLAHRRGVLASEDSVGPVPRMSSWPNMSAGDVVSSPGADTTEVLGEIGWDAADIESLLASGVVVQADA